MTTEKARVFYVDDEPSLLDVTKAFLEAEGDIVVDTEESSKTAIKRLDERRYDVLVCDYQIPDMDGIELLRELRERGDTIPFILFTGKGREEVAMEALNSGANFYLQKGGDPVSQFGELRHAVIQLVQKNRMEGRLMESERRLSTLMDNLPGMAYRCRNDENWTMEFVSDGSWELTGHSPRELTYNRRASYASLIVPAYFQMVWDEVQTAISEKRPYKMIYQIRTAQGKIKWVWEQGEAVFVENGTPVALEGFISDITDQKMAEEKLRQANIKLNLLTRTTRDDIRDQLLTIDGYTGLLKLKTADPELLRIADMIDRSLEALQSYISFTKDYEAMGSAAPAWQGIGTIISNLSAVQEPGHIRLTEKVRSLEILADPLLPKVFHTLIEDSNRYGGRPVTIGLDCRKEGNDLVIVYQDDGVGVPQEDKERIFEKGVGKGTGLGLFLARSILDVTGMAIKETGELGKGARFEIIIPPGRYRFVR